MTVRTPTSTKLSGDVPEEHKNLALALSGYEKEVNDDPFLPLERKAQSYVCLAHDWYQLGMDEEGGRLLLRAEQISPGYFKEKMLEHASENKDFALVVKNITIELMFLVTSQLKEAK